MLWIFKGALNILAMFLKWKPTLFLFLTFLSLTAEANQKKFALIRRIQGFEQLPNHLSRQLQTSILAVVSRQKGYELLLAGTDSPEASTVEMVAVEAEVVREKKNYRFELRLIDVKTKKLITKASGDDVREEDLLRLFQGGVESLFIPDQPPEDESKTKPPVKNEKKKSELQKNQPPEPITAQLNQPDKQTVDFQKRIREMKSGADKAIAKTAAESKKSAAASNGSANKSNSNLTGTAKPPVAYSEEEMGFEKEKFQKKYAMKHTLMAGYDTREVGNDYYINTTSKAQFLTLRAAGHQPLFFDGHLAASWDVAYSRPLSTPAELPTIYQGGIFGTYLEKNWNVALGVTQDSTFFMNIAAPGAGLTAHSLTSNWIKAKSEFSFDIKGRWQIGLQYAQAMSATTNYKPLEDAKEWKGTSMLVSITPPYNFRGWESNLYIERLNLTSQGVRPFTLNESRYALSIRRSL